MMYDTFPAPTPANATQGEPPLSPYGLELVALAVIVLLDLLLLAFRAHWTLMLVSSLLLIVTMAAANWQMARTAPASLWTPLFALRTAAALFLGVGTIGPELAGGVQLDHVMNLYPYSHEEAAKTCVLWASGMFILLGSMKLASRFWKYRSLPQAAHSVESTEKLGILFVAAGLGYILLVDLPASLGLFAFIMPGSVTMMFQAANGVGIFLLSLWAFRRGGAAYLVIFALAVINIFLGLILLSKSVVLFALLFVALAYLLVGFSFRRVIIAGLLMALALSVLQPMVAHSRISHALIYRELIGSSVNERLSRSWGYIQGERLPERYYEPGATALTRLSYIHVASFVVTRYDQGLGSTAIDTGLISLIPRVVWPDKPDLSAIGTELYQMISGRANSALGATVIADLYWNYGWAGLLLLIPMGGYFWWAGYTSYRIVVARDWIMMPFVLMTYRIGLTIDNMFILAMFSPAVMSIVCYFLLKFGKGLIQNKNSPEASVTAAGTETSGQLV